MACPCCVASDVHVIVNGKDISHVLSAVSVDTQPDVIREPLTSNCWPIGGDQWMMLFGPGKTSVQITAYPFGGGSPFPPNMGGLSCNVNVSINVPWKMIYDCRLDADCVDADGKVGKKKGKWVMLPLKKKTIIVTGDVSNSPAFEVGGCTTPAPKFSVQATAQQYYVPQQTMQYSRLIYRGNPFVIDTNNLDTPFTISVLSKEGCGGLPNIEAYLTSFNFSFTPPSNSSLVLGFDVPFTICPGTCR